MADSLSTLLYQSETIEERRIVEPIGNYATVMDRIRETFPETIYSHSQNTMLHSLLSAMIGEAGIGGVKKKLVYPRISDSIYNTYFSDLDALYGSIFGLTRLQEEIYPYSPDQELITIDQFREIRSKDSAFQARAIKFMRGLQMGSTMDGLALLCEAVSGIECTIVEQWRYLDDEIADYSIQPDNLGSTRSSSEIVIVPDTDDLSLWERRRISNAMSRFGPVATVFSINPRKKARLSVPIRDISSSSSYFQAERFVTGSPIINYPKLDPRYGLWIESDIEHQKPSLPFSEGQELTTWVTIENASASSFHAGNFNETQRHIFDHQRDLEDPGYLFLPEEGFIPEPVPLTITSPWVNRGSEDRVTVVNESFNLGYFSDSDINTRKRTMYWASEEALPPKKEFLEFSLGRPRKVNFIEFEISTKPVRFEVEFLNDAGVWETVPYIETEHLDGDREVVFTINSNIWHLSQINFERVETSAIRIVMERVGQKFPYPNSPDFPWSIEIRNTRIADVVQDRSDLNDYEISGGVRQIQSGRDILGNRYRTIINPDKFSAARVLDNNQTTFWQSQTNLDPFAVESLYLDIRQPGGGPSTVDEFYIDPITSGCWMNVYWSNEISTPTPPLMQTADDWRLWTPDPGHYTLAKGRYKFRRPITARFLKFEFTRLNILPYPIPELQVRDTRYKTHPSWSEKHVSEAYNIIPTGSQKFYDNNGEVVSFNYTNLGIISPGTDKLSPFPPMPLEEFDRTNIPKFERVFEEYRAWERQIDDASTGRANLQSEVEIEMTPFQTNLIDRINPFLPENKTLLDGIAGGSTFFTIEIPLRDKTVFDVGSVSDKEALVDQKTRQEVWFPIRARHGYKVLEARRDKDVGYHVAIKDLRLFRSHYGGIGGSGVAAYDHDVFIDNLVDNVNFEDGGGDGLVRNESDWGLIPSQEFASPTNQNFGEYLFEYKPLVPYSPPVTELPGSETLDFADVAHADVVLSDGVSDDTLGLADSGTIDHNLGAEGQESVFISDDAKFVDGGFALDGDETIEVTDEARFAPDHEGWGIEFLEFADEAEFDPVDRNAGGNEQVDISDEADAEVD